MTVISADEARMVPLDHHHLLDSSPASVAAISRDLVGLHNTNQWAPYLSLQARASGFTRSDFDRAAWDDWVVARFRAMRLTMFVFPLDVLEIASAATRHIGQRYAAQWLEMSSLSRPQFEAIAADIEELLVEGPLTTRAIRPSLDADPSVDIPGVVSRLCDIGRLVGGRPPRNWRSNVREYHLWDAVLPEVRLDRWGPEDAAAELVRRYVASYGPVTLTDIAWWTGFTKLRSATALDRLSNDVEVVTVDGWRGPLYRIGGDPPPTAGGVVAILPMLDPYVQGYKDRERLIPTEQRDFVWDGGGNAAATILLDGRIVGIWQTTEDPGPPAILFHLLEHLGPDPRHLAIDRLAAAGRLYFDQDVDVKEVATMASLTARGGRSAAHPLDGRPHRSGRDRR